MTPHQRLIEIVTAEIGVKETGGDNHGARVEEFQKAVDGKAQSESWCMAFVQWAIKLVEVQMNVSSPIFSSEHCRTVWNNSPALRVDKPFPGCVVIWQHGNTTNGHTGVVTSVTDTNISTVEGNTSTGKGVDRNGDGVYARIRTKTGSGEMKVIGFLDPFHV